jgi:4-hydroxy-2-oxoheptanedioate aldolase
VPADAFGEGGRVRENKTKLMLSQRRPVLGVLSSASEPMIAEMIGLAGFDYYMVDGEHGPLSPAQAIHIVRACEVVGVTPLVRVGPKDPKLVLQYLDAGMMGVVMPGLETVAELEMLVAAIKYPPQGKRGMGYGRTVDYNIGPTPMADHIATANAHTLVLPQFEDVELLDRLPELAAVDGVDGFVIGPLDLSLSMGFVDGPGHPEVHKVIDDAIKIIRDAGLVVGITAATAEGVRAQIERGAQMVIVLLSNLIGRNSNAFLQALSDADNRAGS